MSHVYDRSSSNRTSMPFNDLQGILNAQYHTVSDLLTILFLCLRILSYNRAICWYSDLIDLERSGRVVILYSKDMSVMLYFASGTFSDDTPDLVTRL